MCSQFYVSKQFSKFILIFPMPQLLVCKIEAVTPLRWGGHEDLWYRSCVFLPSYTMLGTMGPQHYLLIKY